jgi:hypothetical protein
VRRSVSLDSAANGNFEGGACGSCVSTVGDEADYHTNTTIDAEYHAQNLSARPSESQTS